MPIRPGDLVLVPLQTRLLPGVVVNVVGETPAFPTKPVENRVAEDAFVGPLQLTMLFGLGLLLGLAIGPTIDAYSSLEDGGTIIAQAAGLTALFMAAMGTVGYVTKRDLTWLGRVSFFALLALIVFGIVAIFVSIPSEYLIWSIGGLVIFAGLTVYDFWRLRRAGNADVALIALSIFLDAFNVFLFFLLILGGGGRD